MMNKGLASLSLQPSLLLASLYSQYSCSHSAHYAIIGLQGVKDERYPKDSLVQPFPFTEEKAEAQREVTFLLSRRRGCRAQASDF